MERGPRPEQQQQMSLRRQIENQVAFSLAVTAGVVMLATMALSPEQRRAIRDRDDNRCQAPHPESDGPTPHGGKGLEVHHISPQRWEADMGIPEEVRDRPENLLTVCEKFHREHIHPDMETARKEYGMDKNSYKKAFQYRNEQVARREPYWNTEFDAPMFQKAKQLTQKALAGEWIFPAKPPKKEKGGERK